MTANEGAVRRPDPERLFFAGMGLLILLLIVIGFAPSFYLRGLIETERKLFPLTPLILVHGALFTGWILLFVTQTALISLGRYETHKMLGRFGAALAAAMVVVGLLTAVQQVGRGSGPPGIPPLAWLAVPVFDMVTFGGLVATGIGFRRHAQTHKRLMLLATLLMLQPTIGRMPLPPDALYGELTTLVAWALTLPLIAWDFASRGRPHLASVIGVGILGAEQLLRLAVWQTEAWRRIAVEIVAALT